MYTIYQNQDKEKKQYLISGDNSSICIKTLVRVKCLCNNALFAILIFLYISFLRIYKFGE